MTTVNNRRPAYRSYPWDDWFAKSEFTLVRGKHFDCMTHSMIAQIRTAARQRKKQVAVQVYYEDKILVTVR